MRDVKIVLRLNSKSFISIFFDSWPLAVLAITLLLLLDLPNLSDPCHAIKVIRTRCNYFFLGLKRPEQEQEQEQQEGISVYLYGAARALLALESNPGSATMPLLVQSPPQG